MRKTIKRLMAACLIICMLPFADYSTALAAGNAGVVNTGAGNNKTGNAGAVNTGAGNNETGNSGAVNSGVENTEAGNIEVGNTGIEEENGGNQEAAEPEGNMAPTEDSTDDIYIEPAGAGSTEPFALSENNTGDDGLLPEAGKTHRTGESADCNMQIHAQIHKKGYVELCWQEFEEGASGYRIYRNEQLLAETEEPEFHDRELEKKAAYTYKVAVLGEEGQEIAQDYSTQIELPDNYQMDYNSSLILEEDMIVYDLNASGELDLNGHSLTVLNDASLNDRISFHGGSLLVNHDVQINCSGYEMTAEEDYLYAGGNVSWNAWSYGYYDGRVINLQKGTMEIKGDFLAGETDTFLASEDFCTIFNGEEKQTIELYKGEAAFGRVELANNSEEGVYAREPFVCSEFIQNDTRLVVGADEVTSGFELEEDMMMEGDFCLGGGILDLAGHTLTIRGSLIQTGGTVFVNSGRLVIEGDYRIQSRMDNEDENTLEEYQYGKSAGILNMTMDGDEVLVKGGFYTDSKMDHQGMLTKGTLEVKGDFYEYAQSSFGNFIATDEHKVILSGEGKQTVSFGINRASASGFSNLELRNASEEGILFVNRPYVAGELNGNDTRTEGEVSVGSRTVYKNGCYGGDIYVIGNFAVREPLTIGGNVTVASYLSLYDRMTVEGNVTVQKNCLIFMGGELIVKQNFSVPGGSGNYGIKMTNETDRLSVSGDFYYEAAGSMSKSAGTIEVKGNVEIVKGFIAEGSHVFLLNGDGKQEVSMKEGNAFYELWVENYSEEGVHVLTDIIFDSVKENGCNITYFSGMLSKDETVDGDYELTGENFNFNGKTLTVNGDYIQRQGILKLNKGKLVVEGDFILSEGTVQMTGGSIIVKGSLIQEGGTIQVENGSLTIEGDYRLQKRSGQEADYSYEACSGILQMTKEGGRVLVKGDFHTASTADHTDCFTNGILEIKGNLVQETGGNECNLVFSMEHLILLSGTEKQTVSFLPVKLEKDKLYYQRMSCIANLEITNKGKEGIEFINEPVVNGRINDNHNKITGAISIININWNKAIFEDGYYGGDIALWCGSLGYGYKDEIHIAGDVRAYSGLSASNNLEIEGDCVVIEGSMNPDKYCISIGGNLTIKNTSYGLYFSNIGKVVVEGNLDYQPDKYREGYLESGTLEVKGNALISGSFRSSGTQVIFSGEKKQMIYAGAALFKRLVLSNNSEEGVIANMLLNYSDLETNGCRIVYGMENDLEYAVTGFTLQEDYIAKGDLYLMDGNMDLNGHTLTVEGDLIQASGDMNINGGVLIVKGSYRMQYRTGLEGSYKYGSGKGGLVMIGEKDRVLVCGDFYCSTLKNMSGLLTNGTMEVRGDFRQNAAENFIATENHTVVLGRKLDENGNAFVQTVSFERSPGIARFHKVVLTKLNETGYVFKNDISSISDEVLYDYCDEEPPSAVTKISVTGAECSSITIAYEGAVDNEKILGYEIYRDGMKIGETSAKSFKDSGLKADKEYTYQVFAFDGYRNVAKTSPECAGRTLVDLEAPEAVKGLQVKSVTGSSITLTWRKAADNVEATDYKVYRNGKEVAVTNGELLYKDTGLSEGKVYMYQVSALDESGNESELGEGIEASVIFPQIDTVYPADGSTIGGETAKLTILYKYRSNALENKVTVEYYDENKREWISIASGLKGEVLSPNQYYVARCTWDISEFTGTKQMKIRYSVTDVDGNSDSRQVHYEINRTPPKAPAHVKATSSQGNVELSWEPSISIDCTGYLIFRRDMESNTCEKIAQVSGIYKETYVDKNATAGKEYEYWLVAVDKYEQKSAVSSSAFVVVEPDKEAPQIKNINLNKRVNQKVTISVEASDNKSVKSVILYYRMAGQDTWYSLGENQAEKNREDIEIAQFAWYTNRITDGKYEIKAVAKDAAGNLSAALTKECEVDNTGISKVEILEGSATSTEIQLVWSQALEKDISYFVVERKNDRNASILKSYIKATGCKISDLSSDTEYVLRVVGYDLLGNRGEPSDWYTISTKEDTIAPVIRRIGPNISAYNSRLSLEAEIEDNVAVGQAVFSYSYDKINYEQIAAVNSYESSKKQVLSYLWDVSNIKEGTVCVKFEAYDKAGNKNGNTEEVIAEYIVDRTPPKVVENVQISGESGAIKLQWKQEEDAWKYEIYRAEEGTNFYRLLYTATSDSFVDKSCSCKKTYAYQIVAVDRAGNRSELSEPVIWTAEKDTEAPVIHACTIKDNEVIGGNPTIKLTASDNVSLKEINLKYRKAGESAWEIIGDFDVSGDLYRLETVWETTGLESGQYEFQAMAEDINGNGSISYQKQFTLDVNAPKAPDISVTEKDGKVLLDISENEEPDFSHYNIYKMSRGEEGYRLLKQVTANQFEDREILPETRYYYYVEACDKAGNAARTSEVYILTSDADVVPPNAKLSDVMGIEGREIAFSGEKSTDNIKIESYKWDMGDGTILYGKNPKHIYQTAGEYRVTLTVTDGKGNQASTTAIASVKDKTKCGIHTIYVKNSMDQLMAGAAVYICFADGTVKEMETDGDGKVIISGTAGGHAAAVFVSGYLIAEKNFNISVYEDLSTTIILQEGSMVGGEITAEKLSIEDIKKYGIDVTDEENFFEYSYKVQASFESAAVPGYEFQFRGSTKKTSTGNKIIIATGSSGGGGGENNSGISTSAQVVYAGDEPVVAYCTTAPASVKWLKNMYIVTVTIQNYADEKYVIEDSNVILNLPNGISLAKLMEEQTLSQAMGSIKGKSSATASWIVKADKTGEYQVSADFKGKLQPFQKEITAQIENKIKFGADSGTGLHLYIYPENTAYIGEKYYFQYQLKNESEEPVYYVTAKFGAYRTSDFVQVVDTYVNGELTQSVPNSTGIKYYTASTEGAHIPILCEGDSVTVETLGAGQSICGTYCEYFPGGGDPANVYYKLSKAVAKKLSDSNGDMKVTVMPVQGHMTKANIRITLPVEDDTDEDTGEESGGSTNGGNKKNPGNKKHTPSTEKPTTPSGTSSERDPINVMTGAFESKQCVMAVAGVNDIRFQLAYNSMETDMEGELGYGWYHNYESKIEEQNGLLKVWLTPYDSLLFINEDLMNYKVEGTYRDGEIWLGDMEPENINEKRGISRSTLSENTISENTISENSILENLMPEKAVLTKESGNNEEASDKKNTLALNEEKPGSYVPVSENMNGYSVEKADGVYIFRTPDRTEYYYDKEGQLIKRVNEKGQVLNISHPEGQLVISEPYTEKSITAVLNQNGSIASLKDNGGNQVTFAYDAWKNLSAVTSKGGTSNYYSYDEGHRIVEGRDTDHTLFVQNTYDEKGRVLIQDDGEAATKPVTFRYEDNEENGNTVITMNDMNGAVKTITADSLGKGLRYQDGIGGIFTYAYNEKGDMVSYRNADGTGEDYAYDENGNITKLAETSGRITDYTYDENNRLLSQTCNDGTSLTYTYGENNQPASITSGNGATVHYEYNENGQVAKETVEGLGETAYEYSGGLITQITDSNGNVSKCLYDSIGNVVQYINGKGIITDYEIAPNGKVLKETVTLADGSKAVTSYAYDAYGNQTGKTDANGNTTIYTYDRNDRLVKETRADGSAITYERDVDGNITKITYPDGMTIIEAAYDTAGNLLTLKDALKSTMVQNFNSGSQLVGTALANGGQITYSYYDNGLLKSETDAMGNTTTYIYDDAGRVTGITDKMGNTTSYGYDSAGNAATVTNPEGETVTIAYNQYRQAVSTTDAKGNTTRYEYDGMGNCVRMTDALGHVTEYEYNGSNEIVKVIRKGENGHDDIILTYTYDHLGNVTSVTDGEGNTYRMDYDKVGNLKAVYDAYGTAVESYSYDKVYNQTSVKDAKGNETEMSYDSLGNMVSMLNKATGSATTYSYVGGQLLSSSTDALGGKVTAEYDTMGNIKRFTNPNGGVTEYTYDLNNRVTGESIGSEYKHTYEYNANGQVIKKTNSRGQVTEYTYDKAGRLTSLTDQLGTIRYAYDKNGNVLTVADSQGTITREYDALNRVTSYTDARGNTIRYGYDEFGNLTELTYPNGEKVIYTHDKNGNIKNATDWEGRTTAYEYDRNSRLVKTTRPDGTVETRTYDKAGQLLTILDKKGSQTVNSQEYAYDVSGNITEVKASQKGEMQASGDIANTSMEYDKTNRLIKYNGKEVKYDKDGNMVFGPLNGEMAGFVYDCRNRLVQAGTTKYEYDAEDNRTAVIKNAGTREEVRIEYVVDSVEELSRVLMAVERKSGSETVGSSMENTTDNGTTGSITVGMTASATGNEAFQTTCFYYGNGLLAQENQKEGYLTYHFNNVGSTNAVTDENGVVKYTYAYNPYGELIKGSYGQVMFLFNGQYGVASDDNGLYYMRARYYNVSIKRFVNQDVVTGNLAESQSLNRYVYVEGNPVSYLDPFGLMRESIDEIHALIGEINQYVSISIGLLFATTLFVPETAPVTGTMIEVLNGFSQVLIILDIMLYGWEMATAGDYNEDWFEAFFGIISTLGGIGLEKFGPVSYMSKYDKTQKKATIDAVNWLLKNIYDNIKGVVEAICF